MTATKSTESSEVTKLQTRVQATLADLDRMSVFGMAWETLKNILGISTIATRLITVVAVSEAAVLSDTYVKTRLEGLDKPAANTNKWFS